LSDFHDGRYIQHVLRSSRPATNKQRNCAAAQG
jgi:hypothetical protein